MLPRLWERPIGSWAEATDLPATVIADLEHAVSAGLALADRLRVDVALLQANEYGSSAWQPVVGVEFRAGRYVVGAARGSGLNGVGATYRIGLNAGVLP